MIKFTCPGCSCAHQANDAFANRRAKCVRCGATIVIPNEDGMAWYSDQTRDLPTGDDPVSGGSTSGAAVEESESPKRLLAGKRGLLIAIPLFLVACGSVYHFGFSEPAAPTKKTVVPVEDEQPVTPLPTPATEAGPTAVEAVVPKPTALAMNAGALFVEWTADPAGTDAKYADKLLEVQGNCLALTGARLEFHTGASPADGAPGPLGAPGGIGATLSAFLYPTAASRERPMALLGGMSSVPLEPPVAAPRPGRPAAVRGIYAAGGTLRNGELVRLTAPADDTYLAKTWLIEGTVAAIDRDSLTVTMTSPTTNPLLELSFRFPASRSKPLQNMAPGQRAAIGGMCSGREWLTVRFDNCAVGDVPNAPSGKPAPVESTKVIADYEADLLRYAPIPPNSPPIRVTADQLAVAYRDDPKAADERFARKRLIVSGYISNRDPLRGALQFETGTASGTLRVRAAMLPADFAKLPVDEPELGVQGVFYGKGKASVLRLEDAKFFDPDEGDPNVSRLTADYFPTAPNREWDALRVVYTEPPPPPAKPPSKTAPKPKPLEHPVMRLHYRIDADRVVKAVQVQAGTLAGGPTFPDSEEVKWIGKPVPANAPHARVVEIAKLRTTDWFVEYGIPGAKPGGEETPPGADPKDAGLVWQPMLRLNAKVGRVWDFEPGPGIRIRTSLDSFGKDGAGRPTAKLISTMTDDKLKGKRLETVQTLVKGVGEVKRTVALHVGDMSRVLMEQRMDGDPKVVEPKATVPPMPPKDGPKDGPKPKS